MDYPLGSNGTSQIRLDHDCFLPGFYELTEDIHAQGCCACIQINHAGASAQSARIGMQPASASNLPSKAGGEIPRPLKKEEIYEIVKKYGQAARRAQIAGFDAVELHFGHSYLISQFLSPLTNDRTDEFGGSPENRARLAKLVVEETRKQVGPNFPIIARFSADEFMEGGNTLEDSLNYLQYFQEEIDILDVSCALNGSLQYQIDSSSFPDGWRSYLARAVRERYGKPVITAGNIRSPRVANEILERGDADFIGIGRGLIADPDWAYKAAYCTEADIRKCISCNVGCAGNRIGSNRPIRCTVNPDTIYGEAYKAKKITKPCNVVVVGAGTAGLEAACTAAEVGCTVFLLEKEKTLGGLSTVISRIPEKKRLADFPNYLIRRAEALKNLFIFTDTPATVEAIRPLKPDIIVNSTGSLPLLPPIPGLRENIDKEGGKVSSILKMIDTVPDYPEDLSGKKVAVIGGGAVGLDVMEFFALRGAEVSVIEMLPALGNGLDPITKVGTATIMKEHGVHQRVSTVLQEVKPDSFTVKNPDGSVEEIPFDYGFICLGMKANNPVLAELRAAFEDDGTEVVSIGDSRRARRIIEGTAEGRGILNILERKGYLG